VVFGDVAVISVAIDVVAFKTLASGLDTGAGAADLEFLEIGVLVPAEQVNNRTPATKTAIVAIAIRLLIQPCRCLIRSSVTDWAFLPLVIAALSPGTMVLAGH
jgi:hypothetical protein